MSFKDFSASQADTSNHKTDDKTQANPPGDKTELQSTEVQSKSEPVKKP